MTARLNGSGAWDPDLLCSYSTGRKLEIRDRWLGLLFHFFRGGIAVYVVIYTIILGQAYLKPGDVVGVVRYTLRQPSSDLLWPNGSAPYCLGATGNFTDYSILSTSSYRCVHRCAGYLCAVHLRRPPPPRERAVAASFTSSAAQLP